jgi:hypothetical protein
MWRARATVCATFLKISHFSVFVDPASHHTPWQKEEQRYQHFTTRPFMSNILPSFNSIFLFLLAQRDRVAVAKFVPEVAVKETQEELKAEGSGTALGDISIVKEGIEKRKSDDDVLIKLHNLCFGKPGKATVRKRNLRMFNGFAAGMDVDVKVGKCCVLSFN